MEREDIDLLEEYIIANGIRGKKAWSTAFVKGNLEREEAERINQLREQLSSRFSIFKTGKQKVRKQMEQLYLFLKESCCEEKLEEYRKLFKEKNEKRKEYF